MWNAVLWNRVFDFDTPVLEIFARGSLIYLGIFILLRVIMRRQSGSTTISDILILVLIADAAQNGMAGEYKSVPEGLILVSTLLFWNAALDWLGFHVKWFGRLIHPAPVELIRDGVLNPKNLRRELITRDELMTQLREEGVEDLRQVKGAYLEPTGDISVIKTKE
jgi:uncharacterized membrane protein YcaP (DUF421 family)